MKNIRIIRISIPVIIVMSAVIGFMITYSLAPNAALARIFIDIGALIALLSITYTLPKPEVLQIDDIVDGLRDLAKNRFNRRLPIKDQDELLQVRQAFNELAGTLSDSRGQSLTHIRYNPMNRIEIQPTPMVIIQESLHPELGQVNIAPELSLQNLPLTTDDASFENVFPEPQTLIASKVETETTPAAAIEKNADVPQDKPQPKALRPESYRSDIGAADLFFLFERFKAAHEQPHDNNIDFDDFMTSVHKTREDLIREHHCRDVKFEVVTGASGVALRPRLIR